MAEYRTIRMNFWNDPYIEGLSVSQKLLYIYLFTCPHTNNLGLLEVSTRKIAFETGMSVKDVESAIASFETDKKVLRDGNKIWLTNFIKHQTTTSDKLILSLKKLIPSIGSTTICREMCIRYPHIYDETEYPIDTLPIPPGELEEEGEREEEGEGCAEGTPSTPPAPIDPVVISIPLAGVGGKEGEVRQSDIDEWQKAFPAVNVAQEVAAIRQWNLANPTRRKTDAGYKKHIVSWLKKEQDKGPQLRMGFSGGGPDQFAGVI